MNDNFSLSNLDAYLQSDESPDECMMLSDLDGFLHGVICSPTKISIDEWLPKALGDTSDSLPRWVVGTLAGLHKSILQGLASTPPVVDPVFWHASEGHVVAMDWCEGFMDAVAMRPKAWLRLTESEAHSHLMTPIMAHLFTDEGQSVLGIPEHKLSEVLDEAAKAIPTSVVGVYKFWRTQEEPTEGH
jgi:yecA family protein